MRKENTLRPARDCVFNNMTWPVSQKTGPMGNLTRKKKHCRDISFSRLPDVETADLNLGSYCFLLSAQRRSIEAFWIYDGIHGIYGWWLCFCILWCNGWGAIKKVTKWAEKNNSKCQKSSYSFAETHQRFGTSKDIPCRGPHLWLYESQQVKNWESRIFEGKLDDSWYDPQKLVSVAIIVRFWGRGLSLVYAREVIRSPHLVQSVALLEKPGASHCPCRPPRCTEQIGVKLLVKVSQGPCTAKRAF